MRRSKRPDMQLYKPPRSRLCGDIAEGETISNAVPTKEPEVPSTSGSNEPGSKEQTNEATRPPDQRPTSTLDDDMQDDNNAKLRAKKPKQRHKRPVDAVVGDSSTHESSAVNQKGPPKDETAAQRSAADRKASRRASKCDDETADDTVEGTSFGSRVFVNRRLHAQNAETHEYREPTKDGAARPIRPLLDDAELALLRAQSDAPAQRKKRQLQTELSTQQSEVPSTTTHPSAKPSQPPTRRPNSAFQQPRRPDHHRSAAASGQQLATDAHPSVSNQSSAAVHSTADPRHRTRPRRSNHIDEASDHSRSRSGTPDGKAKINDNQKHVTTRNPPDAGRPRLDAKEEKLNRHRKHNAQPETSSAASKSKSAEVSIQSDDLKASNVSNKEAAAVKTDTAAGKNTPRRAGGGVIKLPEALKNSLKISSEEEDRGGVGSGAPYVKRVPMASRGFWDPDTGQYVHSLQVGRFVQQPVPEPSRHRPLSPTYGPDASLHPPSYAAYPVPFAPSFPSSYPLAAPQPFAHSPNPFTNPPPSVAHASHPVDVHDTPHIAEAQELLVDIQAYVSELEGLMCLPFQPDLVQRIDYLRLEMQSRYKKLLLLDIDFFHSRMIPRHLWRSNFYLLVDAYRKQVASLPANYQLQFRDLVLEAFKKGLEFYEGLLRELDQLYRLNLDSRYEPACATFTLQPAALKKQAKLALVVCQEFLLSLGDLSRYRHELLVPGLGPACLRDAWLDASAWYLRAQRLLPKNAKSYHQLAVLAQFTGRLVDSVYYYTRCLSLNAPVDASREQLLYIFGVVQRKAQALEQERAEQVAAAQRRHVQQRHDGRLELWIRGDGSSQSVSNSADDDEPPLARRLRQMPLRKLTRRFSLGFLHCHGKLFSHIGLDNFDEFASCVLMQLRELLQRRPLPFSIGRLLQFLAINIFSVHQSASRVASSGMTKSLPQQYSVQFCLDAFGLLCESLAAKIRDEHDAAALSVQSSRSYADDCRRPPANEPSCLGDVLAADRSDISCLLGVCATYGDWLSRHTPLWNPPPCISDPDLGPNVDVWRELAALCNRLNELMPPEDDANRLSAAQHVHSCAAPSAACDAASEAASSGPLINCPPVFLAAARAPTDPDQTWTSLCLSERVYLLGLAALHQLWDHEQPLFVKNTLNTTQLAFARNWVRARRMVVLADFLAGLETHPVFEWNVEQKRYIALISSVSHSEMASSTRQSVAAVATTASGDGGGDGDVSEADLLTGVDEGQALLLRRHRELKELARQREREHLARQAALEQEMRQHRQQAVLKVQPLYLVPDTNCFLDRLDLIQRLVEGRRFKLYVPIIVVNELEYLARPPQTRFAPNSLGAFVESPHARHRSPAARSSKAVASGDGSLSAADVGGDDDGADGEADFVYDDEGVGIGDDDWPLRRARSAQRALQYLDALVDPPNARCAPNVRAVAADGTELMTLKYRHESPASAACNDDVILDICMKLCRKTGSVNVPTKSNSDSAGEIIREVVLLTADRNLRIKAHAERLPVRDLVSFAHWARLR